MSRITLVSGDFVPTGGMDMPNLALASFLARQGHELHVVAHRVDPSLTALPNVRLHRAPKPLDSYFVGAPCLDWLGRHVGAPILRAGGRAVVNGANCQLGDVNWVHYVHAAYEPPSAVGGWRSAKRVVERRLGLIAERRALKMARVIIANSQRTRRDLVESLRLPEERIRVIYYGIDPERFRPATLQERNSVRDEFGLGERPTVVFVGALADRRKGFDTVFTAWQRLTREADWDGVLLVAGHGAELPRWRERARLAGLAQSIRFLGFRRDVARIMAGADALVAPTRYEAFGQGICEALCAGLPAIVSRAAGAAERLSPELAQLALGQPDSPEEVAGRLLEWRKRCGEFRELAVAHSRHLRQRTWDTMAREIADLL